MASDVRPFALACKSLPNRFKVIITAVVSVVGERKLTGCCEKVLSEGRDYAVEISGRCSHGNERRQICSEIFQRRPESNEESPSCPKEEGRCERK